ncbi:hypothetical protein ZWY2020_011757 [Hordeum vulgare]|nr:hypothetical protein ZWY2020_011757 [Hordeum vulgare]
MSTGVLPPASTWIGQVMYPGAPTPSTYGPNGGGPMGINLHEQVCSIVSGHLYVLSPAASSLRAAGEAEVRNADDDGGVTKRDGGDQKPVDLCKSFFRHCLASEEHEDEEMHKKTMFVILRTHTKSGSWLASAATPTEGRTRRPHLSLPSFPPTPPPPLRHATSPPSASRPPPPGSLAAGRSSPRPPSPLASDRCRPETVGA